MLSGILAPVYFQAQSLHHEKTRMSLQYCLTIPPVLLTFMLITACASTSSELTYKAAAPGRQPCKVASFSDIWQANPKLETGLTTQSRMTNPRSEFTEAQQRLASFATFSLLGTFKRSLTESMNQHGAPSATPPQTMCRLAVKPLKIVHDIRGGDNIILESSVIDSSGTTIWVTKIKTESPKSGRDLEIVQIFSQKLSTELRADRFLD